MHNCAAGSCANDPKFRNSVSSTVVDVAYGRSLSIAVDGLFRFSVIVELILPQVIHTDKSKLQIQ